MACATVCKVVFVATLLLGCAFATQQEETLSLGMLDNLITKLNSYRKLVHVAINGENPLFLKSFEKQFGRKIVLEDVFKDARLASGKRSTKLEVGMDGFRDLLVLFFKGDVTEAFQVTRLVRETEENEVELHKDEIKAGTFFVTSEVSRQARSILDADGELIKAVHMLDKLTAEGGNHGNLIVDPCSRDFLPEGLKALLASRLNVELAQTYVQTNADTLSRLVATRSFVEARHFNVQLAQSYVQTVAGTLDTLSRSVATRSFVEARCNNNYAVNDVTELTRALKKELYDSMDIPMGVERTMKQLTSKLGQASIVQRAVIKGFTELELGILKDEIELSQPIATAYLAKAKPVDYDTCIYYLVILIKYDSIVRATDISPDFSFQWSRLLNSMGFNEFYRLRDTLAFPAFPEFFETVRSFMREESMTMTHSLEYKLAHPLVRVCFQKAIRKLEVSDKAAAMEAFMLAEYVVLHGPMSLIDPETCTINAIN